MCPAKRLAKQLRNVGPKLAARLVDAGVDTPQKLRDLGAVKAFEAMYPNGDAYGDFNAAYLYALEGAIRDCDWADLPEDVKLTFKNHAKELQQKNH